MKNAIPLEEAIKVINEVRSFHFKNCDPTKAQRLAINNVVGDIKYCLQQLAEGKYYEGKYYHE